MRVNSAVPVGRRSAASATGTGILVAAMLSAVVAASRSTEDFVGLQHFQPCYFINASMPCLHDGAVQIAALGSRAFKFGLSAGTPSLYPFNNDGENAWPKSFQSLAGAASSTQVRTLLSNKAGGGTNFSSWVMWAYSLNTDGDGYWCSHMNASDAANEIAEFSGLTATLMSSYAGTGMSFTLEHWEGDWAARCGSYNATQPPSATVAGNMIRWLQARQDGVVRGRAQFCFAHQLPGVDCSNGTAVMAAAGVFVYNGAEVNLVGASINTTFPNIIRSVIPHVALDTVSYSSYDTQGSPTLGPALDFIFSQMNRSDTSPPQPVFITEWGLPLNQASTVQARTVAQNVIGVAATKPFVSRVIHWQVINNELIAGGNCGSQPVSDPSLQRGFWAVQPDGNLSFFGSYLQSIINGSIPIPNPP